MLRQSARRAITGSFVRQSSALRKISLPRLEREIQLRRAAGQPLDEEMRLLAGLRRIQYVIVYPESGDLVLAGPAGDWTTNAEGRQVALDSGRPLVRLDDLVVILRHVNASANSEFGCSITPTQEGLAKAKSFLEASAKKPLKVGQSGKWLNELRNALGPQTIEVFGIDPRSRVAEVIVEADYHMKLVGIGLEKGTVDVPSYLSMIKAPTGLDVLRWWFTLNYDAVLASTDRDVFELRGQGVKVLSENELLTETGRRVHTGDSDVLNSEFAQRFTKHFAALAAKYPIYAELQNVFDLALAMNLIKSEGLADRVDWHMLTFSDPEQFIVARGPVPRTVDTVLNHRVVNRTQIIAAVSGGVTVDPRKLVTPASIKVDRKGSLGSERHRSSPQEVRRGQWWWD